MTWDMGKWISNASVERAKLQQGILIFLKLTNNQNIDMREHML